MTLFQVNNDVEPKQAVSIIEGLIKAERYEESSFNMWILQEILKDIKLSQEQRTKVICFNYSTQRLSLSSDNPQIGDEYPTWRLSIVQRCWIQRCFRSHCLIS